MLCLSKNSCLPLLPVAAVFAKFLRVPLSQQCGFQNFFLEFTSRGQPCTKPRCWSFLRVGTFLPVQSTCPGLLLLWLHISSYALLCHQYPLPWSWHGPETSLPSSLLQTHCPILPLSQITTSNAPFMSSNPPFSLHPAVPSSLHWPLIQPWQCGSSTQLLWQTPSTLWPRQTPALNSLVISHRP